MHVTQPLAKPGKTINRSMPRVFAEIAVCTQALREPNGLSQTIDNDELAVAKLANDHMKTIGPQIDRGDYFWCDIATRFNMRGLCSTYLIFRSGSVRRSLPIR